MDRICGGAYAWQQSEKPVNLREGDPEPLAGATSAIVRVDRN